MGWMRRDDMLPKGSNILIVDFEKGEKRLLNNIAVLTGEAVEHLCKAGRFKTKEPVMLELPRMDSLICCTCGETFNPKYLDEVVAHLHQGLHEVTGIIGVKIENEEDE